MSIQRVEHSEVITTLIDTKATPPIDPIGVPVHEVLRQFTVVADGVHRSWFIPPGMWAIDDASMVTLQMAPFPGITNFMTLPYNDPSPLGFTMIRRNAGYGGGVAPLQQMVSVNDLATGFQMNNIPGSGNVMRMIWKERWLAIDPPHPRAAFLGGAPQVPTFNNLIPWRFTNNSPNGIVIADPGIPNAVMEIWRWRHKPGLGRVLPTLKPNREQPEGWGQRFLPWARGPFASTSSPFIAGVDDVFAAGSVNKATRERKFKVCYYLPAPFFARSALSTETIRSNFHGPGDRMGNPPGVGSDFVRGRLFWIDR
jgi:hypothetical protein